MKPVEAAAPVAAPTPAATSTRVPAQDSTAAAVDTLRSLALDTLAQASSDGRLEVALSEVLQLSPGDTASPPAAAPAAGAAAIPSGDPAQAEQLRGRVRNLLEEACETGALGIAISAMLPAATSPGPLPPPGDPAAQVVPSGNEEVLDIKVRMRMLLEDASDSGKLLEVLQACVPVASQADAGAVGPLAAANGGGAHTGGASDGADADLNNIKVRMKRLLESACESGALEESLHNLRQNSDIGLGDCGASPVDSAITAAVNLANGGALNRAADDPQQQLDDIKRRMKRLLEESCESGALAESLQSFCLVDKKLAAGQGDTVEEMKARMKRMLEGACESGKLNEVLQEAALTSKKTVLSTEKPQQPQAADPEWLPLEDLRARTRNLLESACETGSLEAALQQMPKQEPSSVEVQDLRERMLVVLQGAYESGA